MTITTTEHDERLARFEQGRIERDAHREVGRRIAGEHWRRACELVDAEGDVSNVARARVHAQLAALAFDNPIGVAKALRG